MNSGRKHLPPPTELHYHSGQVVVLYAEDERIKPRRVETDPETTAIEATTSPTSENSEEHCKPTDGMGSP